MKKLLFLSLLFLFPLAAFSQTPSFSTHSSPTTTFIRLHGDVNGDGFEDLINDYTGNFSVLLSNGDGTYRAPITYTIPSGSFAVLLGDFNGDGKLDVVVQGNSSYSLYFGNGDGTFRAPVTHTLSSQLEAIGAEDVNHDGKTDLLLLTTSDGGNTSDLQVLFANGNGTFTTGPTTSNLLGSANSLHTGDFDGDGKADVVVDEGSMGGEQLQVLYGDNTGNYTVTYPVHNNYNVLLVAADLNGDGVTDLVGTTSYYCVSCKGQEPYLTVYYGKSDRTLTHAEIPTTACAYNYPAVADFNGDSIPDVAFAENACSGPTTTTMTVLSGKGNGQFGPETGVYTTSNYNWQLYDLRDNRDTKPDLVFSQANSSSGYPAEIITLLNQTSGDFPTCAPPNAAVGINVCSPTPGSTVGPAVIFNIGAAGDTPMQRVELWVDGRKELQQFAGAFSNYAFMDGALGGLTPGSHRIVIFAAGTDNSLEEKVFTLNVTGSSSCSPPSSAGVHICSPLNGSSVPSPVNVQAAGTVTGTFARMELWVDGVKKYTSATPNLSTTVALAAGSHRFAVLAINTAGQKWEAANYATVQ